MMHDRSPETFTVRILGPGEIPMGIGTLVGEQHIVTCAHVVNLALGRNALEQTQPHNNVTVDFPFLRSAKTDKPPVFNTRVARWVPPPREGAAGDDIAGLMLIEEQAPPGAIAARLAVEVPRPGRSVRVFGSPGGRPHGQWVDATLRGTVGDGLLQLDSASELRIRQGFSGSPVFDDRIGRVVGIVALAPVRQQDRDGYAIGAERLRYAWPEVFDARRQQTGRTHGRDATELTVLHVSSTRFGATSGLEGQLANEEWNSHPLFGKLHDDLAGLARDHGLWPDLLVVTGNLTEHGRPTELRQATEFLAALAETAEIPRRNVAVIPGSRDISRAACHAYFLDQEGEGAEPVPPYFPKWKHYAAAFADFYADADGATFTPDEPWTLFEMPELAVVVAGLNSTIKESHLPSDSYGWVGERQLRRFADQLEDYRERGWLRIAAVHHDVNRLGTVNTEQLQDIEDLDRRIGSNNLAHLLFHGAAQVPLLNWLPSRLPAFAAGSAIAIPTHSHPDLYGHYQLVTVRRDGFTSYAREYAAVQHRWIGDTRISRDGSSWRDSQSYELADVNKALPQPTASGADNKKAGKGRAGEPESALVQRPDRMPVTATEEFFERVCDATRARWPDAVVTPLSGYLRVTRHNGGFTKQWPVGVVDREVSYTAVKAFGTGIHAQFASADPHVESELVYGGSPASSELLTVAQQCGFHLCSFIEYQGLLDLRPLAQVQSERLAADQIYPERLYVPQRFRPVSDGNRPTHSVPERDILTGLIGHAIDWLSADDARLVVVLGDFGRGKTAFLRQLARALPRELRSPMPVLVELRNLEKAPTLDALLVQHLATQGVDDINPAKLRYMIRSGRIALLFDGFDELELRVGYDNAADYLRTLLESVTERAKVILTSRTQHFRSTEQVRTALGARVETLAASRVVVLEDFSEEQITEFLTKHYDDDAKRARERLAVIRDIGNLLDLAHNPRMLAFIADLEEDRLRTVQSKEGQISAADLYQEIIEFWLAREAERQHLRGGLPSLGKDERFAACTALALRQWASKSPTIGLNELSAEISSTLTRLTERDYTDEQASHAIGSGSLLVRTDAGAFTFVHQSIMEWLVAAAAARDINDAPTTQVLAGRRMSRLMADFFTDLAGHTASRNWAERTLADTQATQVGKQNALTVLRRTGRASGPDAAANPLQPQNLAGVDLRDQDLTDRDLRGADLRGANLSGMQLRGTDLFGADLRNADLRGAHLVNVSLHGAVLTGSQWDRASLLGVEGLDNLDTAVTLHSAAVADRDPAVVMIQPPIRPSGVAFSPDGTLLAVASGSIVQVFDAVDGRAIRILRGHRDDVLDVTFSPDGTFLATASRDQTARIYGLTAGTIKRLSGHTGAVVGTAFSPDGTCLATASLDNTARIWDLTSGITRYTLSDHNAPVNGVAFSPDGTLLATASGDETARIWDTTTGTARTTLYGHTRTVHGVAFSPDGTLLATASGDNTARIWDLKSGVTRHTLHGHTKSVNSIAFSPDGTLIGTASDDSTARIWDQASGTTRQALHGRDNWVHSVAFSPDGTLLGTASDDNTGRIWDLTSGTTLHVLNGHTGWLNDVAFSPDGTLVATASRDHTARIWDLTSGTTRHVLEGHDRWVNSVAFSPDGTLLATASDDNTARIWNISSGRIRRTLQGHTNGVLGVAFSPDGRLLATASLDRTVQLWNVGAGTPRRAFKHNASVRDVAFSPDGVFLATASRDSIVPVWNVKTGTNRTLAGHISSLNGVTFSPDGTLLATASTDGTSRIWNLATDTTRTVFRGHVNSVNGVAFSPDGTLLATVSTDGTVRISKVGTGKTVVTFLALAEDGYATLVSDSGYKIKGDPGDALWWSIKLCRFTPGELDPFVSNLKRLPADAAILSALGS